MIISSFAKQYGIRLLREDISVQEYRKLLVGVMGDTPLGYVVSIRSEKDRKKINEMTNNEKKIRAEWQHFKMKQSKGVAAPKITMTLEQFQRAMKSLARG